jgi:putative transposase
MPSKPRVEYEGAIQHVATTANNRAQLFLNDIDRRFYLALLGETAIRYGWQVLSYCLMGTHWHAVIRTPQTTLSRGMRRLNSCYSRTFNDAHGRSGHSIRHRFMSIPVEDANHQLELTRYLPLNPVRGGLASHPEDWPWSSYRMELGFTKAPPWLYLGWATTIHGSVTAHRDYVNAGMAEPGATGTPGSDPTATPPRPAG